MSNERQYYEDIGYKPFLFYVVFGVSGDELEVSRTKHNVDGLPEGLDIISLARPDHSDYIDGLIGGGIGEHLKKADSALYESCKACDKVVIMRGEIADDSTFDYMRNLIGICETFIDKGAKGILDLQTFTLYSPKEWNDRFFGKEVNAQNHVTIMISEENGRYWLHTRGVLEFGRPDISLYADKKEDVDEYKQIIDQMVFYSGQGVFFNGKFSLHTFSGNTYSVNSVFVDDFDNDDFNNAYCKVEVLGKK